MPTFCSDFAPMSELIGIDGTVTTELCQLNKSEKGNDSPKRQ